MTEAVRAYRYGLGMGGSEVLVKQRVDRGLSMRSAAQQIGVSLDTLRRAERGAVPAPGRQGGLGEDAAFRIASFYGFKPSELWPIPTEGISNPTSKEAA